MLLHVVLGMFVVFSTINSAFGEYPCLCSYTLESSVYKTRNVTAPIIGYMYEFDCKPTFPIDGSGTSDFFVVQFEQQVGYVENKQGYFSIESCAGSPAPNDLVTTIMSTPPHRETATFISTTPTANTPAVTTKTVSPSTSASTTTPKITTTTRVVSSSQTTKTVTPSTVAPTGITTPKSAATTQGITISQTTKMVSHSATVPITTSKPATTTQATISQTSSTITPSTTTEPITTPKPPTTTIVIALTTPTTLSKPTTTTRDLACPDNWVRKDDSCYYFNLHERLYHGNASNRCSQYNAHLVFINSKQEQNWIVKQLNSYDNYTTGHVGQHHQTTVWIGAMSRDGTWSWVDDTTRTSTRVEYNNWSPDYPLTNISRIQCAAIVGIEDSQWSDFACNHRSNHMFVCERPVAGIQQTSTHSHSTAVDHNGCPDNWTKYHHSCYYVEQTDHTHQSHADRNCTQRNAHLVFINSPKEQTFLEHLLQPNPGMHGYWIGGYHDLRKSTWSWTIGHTYNTDMTYTNWVGGSPPNITTRRSNKCAIMSKSQHFLWADTNCLTSRLYICELELRPAIALIG